MPKLHCDSFELSSEYQSMYSKHRIIVIHLRRAALAMQSIEKQPRRSRKLRASVQKLLCSTAWVLGRSAASTFCRVPGTHHKRRRQLRCARRRHANIDKELLGPLPSALPSSSLFLKTRAEVLLEQGLVTSLAEPPIRRRHLRSSNRSDLSEEHLYRDPKAGSAEPFDSPRGTMSTMVATTTSSGGQGSPANDKARASQGTSASTSTTSSGDTQRTGLASKLPSYATRHGLRTIDTSSIRPLPLPSSHVNGNPARNIQTIGGTNGSALPTRSVVHRPAISSSLAVSNSTASPMVAIVPPTPLLGDSNGAKQQDELLQTQADTTADAPSAGSPSTPASALSMFRRGNWRSIASPSQMKMDWSAFEAQLGADDSASVGAQDGGVLGSVSIHHHISSDIGLSSKEDMGHHRNCESTNLSVWLLQEGHEKGEIVLLGAHATL